MLKQNYNLEETALEGYTGIAPIAPAANAVTCQWQMLPLVRSASCN